MEVSVAADETAIKRAVMTIKRAKMIKRAATMDSSRAEARLSQRLFQKGEARLEVFASKGDGFVCDANDELPTTELMREGASSLGLFHRGKANKAISSTQRPWLMLRPFVLLYSHIQSPP